MDTDGAAARGDGARIALTASDEIVQRRIEAVIDETAHELISVTESVEELRDQLAELDPSMVIVVFDRPPFGQVPELAELRHELGPRPLIVVTRGIIGAGPRKLLRAGLVFEREIEQSLVPTIDAVLRDLVCIPSTMREKIARPVFSHREKQILQLLVQGHTNGEIAGMLFLSESTVKSHVASSFRKLGVSSRAEAVERVLHRD